MIHIILIELVGAQNQHFFFRKIKSKKEIEDIKAASQDSELMKNKLQNINKRIKQKVNAPKKSANNTNQPPNNINEKISFL